MTFSIAYLGPTGTYTENAAIAYREHLQKQTQDNWILQPYNSIIKTLHALTNNQAKLAVVPVENSIHGSVVVTLDTIWESDQLQIQKELILPINHALLSHSDSLEKITKIYSHPQALAQCQRWLEKYLPSGNLIPMNSTTEALELIKNEPESGAISSPRASEIYNTPILALNINDYPQNCTRFWVLGFNSSFQGDRVSLAFTLPKNIPGALEKALHIFAKRNINLSRIESRPTKRYLGEYLFYIDLEGCQNQLSVKEALDELKTHAEILRIFGNYDILNMTSANLL
jgi:prephenate dehydratase